MRLALLLGLQGFLLVVLTALVVERGEAVAVVEVHTTVFGDMEWECGDGAPPVILIDVERDGFVIGEEAGRVDRLADIDAVRARLTALKDAIKDREQVVVQVADDVDHARVVAVLDLATGLELKQLQIYVGRGRAFTPDRWTRPVRR